MRATRPRTPRECGAPRDGADDRADADARLPSRGRPGGLLTPPVPVSQTAIETVRIHASFARTLVVVYSSQIAHGMHCTFDADFCFCTRLRRSSDDQRRAVLDVVKALAALDPAGFSLDDACAHGSASSAATTFRRCRSAPPSDGC